MSATYEVNLMPIEPILFSDNRSAREGEDHLIRDQDPSPHTIYGAISASIARQRKVAAIEGDEWNKKVADLLGTFESEIAAGSESRAELMGYFYQDLQQNSWFPNPMHVVLRKNAARLAIRSILTPLLSEPHFAGSSLTPEGFSHFLEHKPEDDDTEGEYFISQNLLAKILGGENLGDTSPDDFKSPTEMYQLETRLGLRMVNVKNRVEEGLLFSRPYRRFVSGVDSNTKTWRSFSIHAFYKTLIDLDSDLVSQNLIAFLGGDRRRAVIRFEPAEPLYAIRDKVKARVDGSRGFFIYLLTPAVREVEWPQIDNRDLLAAAIGKELTISGWNTNRQEQHPRPIRKLIPAGSTFFYKWKNGEDRSDAIDRHWMQPVSEQYRNSGFGRMLIGVWQ